MKFVALHPNFKLPTYGTERAGALDLYMPTAGKLWPHAVAGIFVPLGFSAAVPPGHVALLLPRSGTGAKQGLSLNNTCGVIDEDYRGEWIACLRVRNHWPLEWDAGDRLIQCVLVPRLHVVPELVESLDETARGAGGFGHSGKN